jgi:hypothetical protein
VIVVREWWHKEKGRPAYRHLEARRKLGGELIAEYTAASPGNAAMVFEAFLAGIFDLSTPLSALPWDLGRAMGRGWLKAENGRCLRLHVMGATECPHYGEDGRVDLTNPAVHAGFRGLHRRDPDPEVV